MLTTIIVVAVVVVLVLAAAALLTRKRRSDRLRGQFGNEYDRTLSSSGSRREAERELRDRHEQHEQLQLRPLAPAAQQRFTEQWQVVQAGFVDTPAAALTQADALVSRLLQERGYPTGDFDQQARLLSVEHADSLQSYRRAHEVELANRAGTATTEQVRTAFLDFRRVFEEVMAQASGDPYLDDPGRHGSPGAPEVQQGDRGGSAL